VHDGNPLGESSGENASKFIRLDEDISDDTRNSDEDVDPMQSLEEWNSEVDEGKLSGENELVFSNNEDIDALYDKLQSNLASIKSVSADEQTPRLRTDDSNSESESSGTLTDHESIVWSSDEEIVDTESDDDGENGPIFEGSEVTYEEHLMAIMSLAARHSLNQAQVSDLIEVIRLHCPKDGKCVSSGSSLYKEVSGEVQIKYHEVCEDCFGLFPEDTTVYRCSTSGCSG